MKTPLQQIIKNDPYSLKALVAQEALDSDNPKIFFRTCSITDVLVAWWVV